MMDDYNFFEIFEIYFEFIVRNNIYEKIKDIIFGYGFSDIIFL